jgi:hypothetical protein
VHVVSFTLIPQELRIGFVATVSFVWLIILSFKSHQTIGNGPGTVEQLDNKPTINNTLNEVAMVSSVAEK